MIYQVHTMTDWSGHIDALVMMGVFTTTVICMFILVLSRIRHLEIRGTYETSFLRHRNDRSKGKHGNHPMRKFP